MRLRSMARMDFEGFDELEDLFENIGKDIEKVDSEALKVGGEIIAKHQREHVDRSEKDHPHIQDNITVSRPLESKDGEKYVAVGPNKKVAWRAKFLEFGTSKMSPRPFLEKGVISGENEAVSAMEKVYLDAIDS
jgi:HK97 gp10 family phage protein